ncbi:hypothetical protein CEXT_422321 [Caerostris extrusa]|uniref:Uncharacterized protein n=1 Tax=Caerostris extrusa TaxID=172846 RepID=A0AAV4U9J6_CAEEX|nr:hypothetical protein CEXT_422321 [Caerostris extrusa]
MSDTNATVQVIVAYKRQNCARQKMKRCTCLASRYDGYAADLPYTTRTHRVILITESLTVRQCSYFTPDLEWGS